MTAESLTKAEELLAKAEKGLAESRFKEARSLAFQAGRAVLESYEQFLGKPGQGPLADRAKALELPFEVFAVADKLDQENPEGPKKMLPVRPEGEVAAERVHQARSFTRFLKWAMEEPPATSEGATG